MKRLIAFIALLAIVGVVLCGCGETQSNPSTEPSTEPSNAPTTPSQSASDPTTPSEPNTDDGKTTYTVTVVDQDGNPVSGVKVQFCDAASCRLPVTTGEDGKVTASYETSEYHITIAKLPDGYSCDVTEYYFEGDAAELTVTVTAS